MSKYFFIAYDVVSPKRAYKIRKLVYSYAIGGQKSALDIPLKSRELKGLIGELNPLMHKKDSINILEVQSSPIIFGKSDKIHYDEGVIIV